MHAHDTCISFLKAIQDSSGIQFNYTTTSRQYNGAILSIGHSIYPNMVVLPNSRNYTVTGMCSGVCTRNVSTITFLCVCCMFKLFFN